jgi:hydroxymethylpyrimidine pyrophosphatase-like HAD family hydrolase
MDDLHVEHAIICNGGKLLIDGYEDQIWTEETSKMVTPYLGELERAIEVFASVCSTDNIKRPEIYMCYATVDNPKAVYEQLVNVIGSDEIVAEYDARKVYLFIRGIDKGNAVKRYVDRFTADCIIAAGDCRIDIPMLNEADYALAPKEILKFVSAPGVELTGDDISFPICSFLEEYYMKGKRI